MIKLLMLMLLFLTTAMYADNTYERFSAEKRYLGFATEYKFKAIYDKKDFKKDIEDTTNDKNVIRSDSNVCDDKMIADLLINKNSEKFKEVCLRDRISSGHSGSSEWEFTTSSCSKLTINIKDHDNDQIMIDIFWQKPSLFLGLVCSIMTTHGSYYKPLAIDSNL